MAPFGQTRLVYYTYARSPSTVSPVEQTSRGEAVDPAAEGPAAIVSTSQHARFLQSIDGPGIAGKR